MPKPWSDFREVTTLDYDNFIMGLQPGVSAPDKNVKILWRKAITKTSRITADGGDIAYGYDDNNVILCTNTEPVQINVFEGGPPSLAIPNWTTYVYATNGDVEITAENPDIHLIVAPGDTRFLKAGQMAVIQKIRDVGSDKYWAVYGANDYEEFNATGNTWTGPYAAPVSAAYKAIRIGKQVFLTLDGFEGSPTIPNFATASVALPAAFRPALQAFAIVAVFDNSVTAPGWVSVFNDGVIALGVGNFSAGFTDSGDGGLLGTTGMTWAV